jgi:hypothetical protein
MKKIAAGAINALKEALSAIYWYKSDAVKNDYY